MENAIMANVAVLVVAVGAAKVPTRAFTKVDNRELFLRTVELYANRDQVKQSILCISPDDMAMVQQKYAAHLGFQGVGVAAGGPDWFGAVARGIEKLKPEIDTVIVHDACRPVVPYTLLDALEAAVGKTGAAVPVLPAPLPLATLAGDKSVDEWRKTDGWQVVQSPQIFARKVLEAAYVVRSGLKGVLLDDASLVRANGGAVTTVPGSRFNERFDSEEGLKLASDFLKHLPKPKPKGPFNPFGEAEW